MGMGWSSFMARTRVSMFDYMLQTKDMDIAVLEIKENEHVRI